MHYSELYFFGVAHNRQTADTLGRRNFAKDGRPHRVRDAAVVRDYRLSPAKKPRTELYPEVRRPPSKPVYKAEPKPAVIEKKPVLREGFKPTKDEGKALPKREVPQKRKAAPIAEPKPITAKPEKPLETKPTAKEVPVKSTANKEEVTQAVKNTLTVEVTPVKEVAPVKNDTPPKEDTTVKEAPPVEDSDKDRETEPEKPTAKPNADGQYELDDVTAAVLNDELQQIMIKVWQELPDEPPTDAEDLVANRFRNEMGDDLQNALGLTITSRLLNVHNPLYVKLLFSGKPESGCLQTFIRKYKITGFKRIADPHRDLFAGRLDRAADYDRLVANTELKCGSATVTITPCYKYLLCPPSVKSVYEDTGKAKKPSYYSMPKKQSVSNKTEKSAQSAEDKPTDTKAFEKKDNVETKKSEKKIDTNLSTTVTNTETNAVAATEKTEANATIVKKTETDVKEDKIETAKVPAEPDNVTPKTTKVGKKNDVSYKIKNSKQDFTDDMMVVDEMEEDDEEMTDQDILALMSGGIVLDECSGSDDEK